ISEGAFHSYEEKIDARKIRTRSESFSDHFSQPALFYRSLSEHEKEHVAEAYIFELGKCMHDHIKQRMLWLINQIDETLAQKVSAGLGLDIPDDIVRPINQAIGADEDVEKHQPGPRKNYLESSPALSQANTKFNTIASRQIAVLAASGVDGISLDTMKKALVKGGAVVKIISLTGGSINSASGKKKYIVDASIKTTESVLYDAVYIPGGEASVNTLMGEAKFIKFINETFKHCKAIATDGEGKKLLDISFAKKYLKDDAIHIDDDPKAFIESLKKHRNWKRSKVAEKVPV
ncbi:MAG: catalase-related domain-containing protein, partial [Ferruginibacter sp.]